MANTTIVSIGCSDDPFYDNWLIKLNALVGVNRIFNKNFIDIGKKLATIDDANDKNSKNIFKSLKKHYTKI